MFGPTLAVRARYPTLRWRRRGVPCQSARRFIWENMGVFSWFTLYIWIASSTNYMIVLICGTKELLRDEWGGFLPVKIVTYQSEFRHQCQIRWSRCCADPTRNNHCLSKSIEEATEYQLYLESRWVLAWLVLKDIWRKMNRSLNLGLYFFLD